MAAKKKDISGDRPVELSPAVAPLSPFRHLDLRAALTWLVSGYLFIVLLAGLAIYYTALPAGNEITLDRAIFTASNALTLTGFETPISINTYLPTALAIVLVLTLLGAVLPMAIGGMAVVRIVRLPYTDAQVIRSALAACAVLTVAGSLPLIVFEERPPLDALMLSASAFGNSGLHLGPRPQILSPLTHFVLLPLAVLGGLGLPVLMELYDALRLRARLSSYAWTILQLTGLLYLAGFAVFLVARWIHLDPSTSANAAPAVIASASINAINARSLGFPFQYAQEFPRVMQWILILFMFIGANPASTGGGIKPTSLLEIARGLRRVFAGQAPGRGFAIAIVWIMVAAGGVLLTLLLLLWTDPQVPADRLLFETVSAIANVGLSHDVIALIRPGLEVLALAMLFGRVTPMLILWWMASYPSSGDELPVA